MKQHKHSLLKIIFKNDNIILLKNCIFSPKFAGVKADQWLKSFEDSEDETDKRNKTLKQLLALADTAQKINLI